MSSEESGERRESSKWSVGASQAPVLAAVFTLIGGTGGAVIKGYFDLNKEVEKQEYEFQAGLVLKAIDSEHEADSRKKLKFFANAGLIPDYAKEIIELTKNENAIPALRKPAQQSSVLRRDQLHQVMLVLADGTPIPGEKWEVTSDFIRDNGKIEHDASGAACADRDNCMLVGNTNRFAYYFKVIDGQKIRPLGRNPYILPSYEKGGSKLPHPDLEAASYDDGFYLFVGSHSVKLSDGCRYDERHSLFLLPKSAVLSNPQEFTGAQSVVPSSLKKASLDYFFESHDYFKRFYDELLQLGGINIEGAVLDKSTVYIGMRAPTDKGNVYVLKFDRDELFDGKMPKPDILALDFVRNGIGIRDMVKIKEGFIFLMGDSEGESPKDPRNVKCNKREEKVEHGRNVGNPFELYFWDDQKNTPRLLGTIFATFTNIVDKVKAEGLLVLPDPWSDPNNLTLLIWFDGIENGLPTSFRIPRRLLVN